MPESPWVVLPAWSTYNSLANWKMAIESIEIVDFPKNNMVMFHSFLYVYQRVQILMMIEQCRSLISTFLIISEPIHNHPNILALLAILGHPWALSSNRCLQITKHTQKNNNFYSRHFLSDLCPPVSSGPLHE